MREPLPGSQRFAPPAPSAPSSNPRKPRSGDRLHDDGARAVAEEHERRAVLPVEDAREQVAADDERALREPAGEHPVRLGERVHEAGASGREVVGGRIGRTEPVGEDRARRRERHVGRDGRDDQQVDVLPLDTGLRERIDARRQRDVGQRLILVGHMALADARALADPLVGGVDVLRQAPRSR